MASASVLGQRAYEHFEDDDADGEAANQSDVALRFEGNDVLAEAPRVQESSYENEVGLRTAAQASEEDATLAGKIEDASSSAPAKQNGDRELARLRNENKALRDEVERLKLASKENAELKQVVTQLKKVVISYGFSELEVMHAKPKAGSEGLEQLRYAPRELFLIISMKFAEIAAYYGGAYIYTNYMTEELGMTDQEAGNVYAAYGLISTLGGLPAGLVIDNLGVRRSLLIGTISSALARFATGATHSKAFCIFVSLTLFPLGGAFGVPVLALGVRRYSHKANRKFAFSIFYTMLMLATLIGTMMINQIRGFFPDGLDLFGWHLTWMRIIFMAVTCFTLYTVLCAFFLRDIQVVDDQPLEDMVIEPIKLSKGSGWPEIKRIITTARFVRLTCVSLIFSGVQTGFRHLDATFPKYMMRTYGPNAPWEVILSVNPVVTFFCAPICTAVLIKYKVGFRKALILGAFLSGFSPFLLATFESYLGAVMWITVMSLGQAVWGPKLYEYSTMSAPAGREGLFVAITAAPIYLSSVPTGILSGWLLEHFCPKNSDPEDRNTRMLWFWVGLSVCTSPVLLWIFRKKLLKRGEDQPPEAQDQGMQLDNKDLTLDEEGNTPTVPSAQATMEEFDAPIGFGNAGAAWAGYDGAGHLTDSDDDFEEGDEMQRRQSTPMRQSTPK